MSKLLRVIEGDFDLIHIHNANVPFVKTSLPNVVTEHGTMKGYVPHRKIVDVQSLVVRVFSSVFISIDRKIIKNADKVIAISKACADELRLFYDVTNLR